MRSVCGGNLPAYAHVQSSADRRKERSPPDAGYCSPSTIRQLSLMLKLVTALAVLAASLTFSPTRAASRTSVASSGGMYGATYALPDPHQTVTATFTVPAVGPYNGQVATWVGIGGSDVGGGGLVQVGVLEWWQPGTSGNAGFTAVEPFYDTCPIGSYQGNDCGTVTAGLTPSAYYASEYPSPGDTVTVGVAPETGGYRVSLWDRTQLAAEWVKVPYPHIHTGPYAQYAVEDPGGNAANLLANFGQVTFTRTWPTPKPDQFASDDGCIGNGGFLTFTFKTPTC